MPRCCPVIAACVRALAQYVVQEGALVRRHLLAADQRLGLSHQLQRRLRMRKRDLRAQRIGPVRAQCAGALVTFARLRGFAQILMHPAAFEP